MKKLMLFEYFRNTVKNTFIAFLLAALCLMMTAMISVLQYEYGKYKPLENMDIKEGFYIPDLTYDPVSDTTLDPEKIEGVERVYKAYRSMVSCENSMANVFIYDSWLWKGWSGRLKAGHWFRDLSENNYIEVIAGGDTENVRPGQSFTITSGDKTANFKVIGILQPRTEIFYKENSYDIDLDSNYNGLYNQPDPYEPKLYFIAQKEKIDEAGFYYGSLGGVFVKYRDGISSETSESITNTIKMATLGIGSEFKDYASVSKKLMLRKVMMYIPTIVVAFLITLLALYCIAYINIMDGRRYYSIYYLVGAGKHRCFLIAAAYALITCIVSVLIFIAGGYLMSGIADRKNIMFSFSGTSKIPALILYSVFTLFLILCIYSMMKKKSALDMIRFQKW